MPEITRTLRLLTCPNRHPEGVHFPVQMSMDAYCKNQSCLWHGEPVFTEVENLPLTLTNGDARFQQDGLFD